MRFGASLSVLTLGAILALPAALAGGTCTGTCSSPTPAPTATPFPTPSQSDSSSAGLWDGRRKTSALPPVAVQWFR